LEWEVPELLDGVVAVALLSLDVLLLDAAWETRYPPSTPPVTRPSAAAAVAPLRLRPARKRGLVPLVLLSTMFSFVWVFLSAVVIDVGVRVSTSCRSYMAVTSSIESATTRECTRRGDKDLHGDRCRGRLTAVVCMPSSW
jgi:hypothetical protein